MKETCVKVALHAALRSVGLTKQAIPQIFSSDRYQKPPEGVFALHVVVEGKRIVVHEYSSERRGSYYRQEHPSLQAFVKAYVRGKIDNACTIYMATKRRDTLEKLKAGSPEDFLEVRAEIERLLNSKLESFLSGWLFSLLKVAV